jgi:predicted transcriptional regulator of viral defense system
MAALAAIEAGVRRGSAAGLPMTKNLGNQIYLPRFLYTGAVARGRPTPSNRPRAAQRAIFRRRELAARGLDDGELRRRLRSGEVERLARGLYRFTAAEITENHTLATVAARVPAAVFCLLTALRVHDIGTQLPHQVWIALPHKAHQPAFADVSFRVVRSSGAMLNYGVEPILFEGVPAHITNPARTVVDCFRFRNKIGRDVALEAARDALLSRKATVDQIMRTARACRAGTVVQRMLEGMG